MAQLRQDYGEFVKRGAEVIVIGPDSAEAFRRLWERETLPFVGLPDPTLSVLSRYGQEVKLLRFGRMPAQVVADGAGMARFAHYGASMADIPTNAELISILDHLGDDEAR